MHELALKLDCSYENVKHWHKKTLSVHCNKILSGQACVANDGKEGEASDQPGLDIPLSLKHRRI